jgi:phosphoglycerate dehydrogenase-like enzyme
MNQAVVIGLGPVDVDVVAPILGSSIKFIENPTSEDFKAAVGAIVRAAYVLDKPALDLMPNLKVISRTGVGTELVDLDEADRREIPVIITPGSNTNAVAEGAFAHILHLSKRLGPLTKLVANQKFAERNKYPVGDLSGSTLGIVGYGRIGKRIAELAQVFDLKVCAYDPFADIAPEIKVETLADLLSQSDIVTLHLPLTPETSGLVNNESLELFRDGAILVNCSRGALIDLDAAYEALVSGKLSGVGLDVFDVEPPVHHRIFDHENVVLTPHVMGLSKKATIATFEDAAQGIIDFIDGKKLKAIANLKNRNQ